MWITTKTLVKEIKQNQQIFEEKFAEVQLEQQERMQSIITLLADIDTKLVTMDQENKALLRQSRESYEKLLERVEHTQELLVEIQKSDSDRFDVVRDVVEHKSSDIKGQIQILGEQIIQEQQKSSKAITEEITEKGSSLNDSIAATSVQLRKTEEILSKCLLDNRERVIAEVKHVASQTQEVGTIIQSHEQNVLDKICEKNMTTNSLIEEAVLGLSKSEENIILHSNEHFEKITEKLEQVIISEQNESSAIHKSIQATKSYVIEMIKILEDHENATVENIETMNYAIQDIIRNLVSLDEGNRLIIAKMLLQNLGE